MNGLLIVNNRSQNLSAFEFQEAVGRFQHHLAYCRDLNKLINELGESKTNDKGSWHYVKKAAKPCCSIHEEQESAHAVFKKTQRRWHHSRDQYPF